MTSHLRRTTIVAKTCRQPTTSSASSLLLNQKPCVSVTSTLPIVYATYKLLQRSILLFFCRRRYFGGFRAEQRQPVVEFGVVVSRSTRAPAQYSLAKYRTRHRDTFREAEHTTTCRRHASLRARTAADQQQLFVVWRTPVTIVARQFFFLNESEQSSCLL